MTRSIEWYYVVLFIYLTIGATLAMVTRRGLDYISFELVIEFMIRTFTWPYLVMFGTIA